MIEQREADAISEIIRKFELWKGYRQGHNINMRRVADRYYWTVTKGSNTASGSAPRVESAIAAIDALIAAGFPQLAKRSRKALIGDLFANS